MFICLDHITVNCSMLRQHRHIIWHLTMYTADHVSCLLNVFCRLFHTDELVNTNSTAGMFEITFMSSISCNKTYCLITYYTLDLPLNQLAFCSLHHRIWPIRSTILTLPSDNYTHFVMKKLLPLQFHYEMPSCYC